MELKDLFYGIQDFFVNVAFAPLDAIRELQDSSWVAANLLNFVFIIIVLQSISKSPAHETYFVPSTLS